MRSDTHSDSGFHIVPFLGRGGRSKIAKVGMAVGSLMAISTCAMAMFGESGLPEVPEFMAEDQMYEVARGLKALGIDD